MTDKELKLRSAIYTLMDGDCNMPENASSFDLINNENDFFFRMLMSGGICFEREDETTLVAFDMLHRHEESTLDGDVTGAARRAAVKLAAKCLIEEPGVRFLAAHGIHAELTPMPAGQKAEGRK